MTAKLTASADGSKVLIGTAAEDALQIDATAKTIKALSPYKLVTSLLTKIINTTTPATVSATGMAHGLDSTKIRSVRLAINYNGSEVLPDSYIGSSSAPFGQYLISTYWDAVNVFIAPYELSAPAVLNKPCVITIQYEP